MTCSGFCFFFFIPLHLIQKYITTYWFQLTLVRGEFSKTGVNPSRAPGLPQPPPLNPDLTSSCRGRKRERRSLADNWKILVQGTGYSQEVLLQGRRIWFFAFFKVFLKSEKSMFREINAFTDFDVSLFCHRSLKKKDSGIEDSTMRLIFKELRKLQLGETNDGRASNVLWGSPRAEELECKRWRFKEHQPNVWSSLRRNQNSGRTFSNQTSSHFSSDSRRIWRPVLWSKNKMKQNKIKVKLN